MGAILTGAMWDESIPTFPLELEKNGYFIGYQYKVWSPGKTENAPIGGSRTRYEPEGRNFNQFSHWVCHHLNELGLNEAKKRLYDETRKNFKYFLEKNTQINLFFIGGARQIHIGHGKKDQVKKYGELIQIA